MCSRTIIFLALLAWTSGLLGKNNVCKKYSDYIVPAFNIKCTNNPDVDSHTFEMIERHGYPAEKYEVITEDNYILTLFRIPHNKKDAGTKRQPIYIQHGANTDSAVWVDIGHRSLAFQLSDMGYDVWLGNIRGSTYSQKHKTLKATESKFWDFSLDEVALYDISGQLNFVANKTGMAGKIIYIGHSMGTSLSYIYSSLKSAEAQKNLVGIISLAPVCYMNNTRIIHRLHYMFRLAVFILKIFPNEIPPFGITPNQKLIQKVFHIVCEQTPLQMGICSAVISYLFGKSTQTLPEDIPLIYSYIASGMSSRSVIHFLQFAQGNFRQYDFGPKENMKRYNSNEPPKYNVMDIKVPVRFYYGATDTLSDKEDINQLVAGFTTDYKINEVAFNHLDFMYAKDITEMLYKSMFDTITQEFKR